MSAKTGKPHIIPPTPEEDALIQQAALADPDAQPLTTEQLAAMTPLRSRRGRPQTSHHKILLSIRYSPEVVAFFRATGAGWQTRMDEALLQYVTMQKTTQPDTPT
jgi:uncharacterized protein (DUF4415 family)